MADKQEGISIIDKDCSVEGTVDVKGKLVIAGSLKGMLIGNTVVTVKGSHVNAPAKVHEMIIGGEFEGDITVYESLRILGTGVFSGTVVCKSITLETGGKLNGRVEALDSAEGLSFTDTALAAGGENPILPQGKDDTERSDRSKPE